jgi:diguanylate cyclase (GGDEF)-like protein/PAS domain S-box-containing protein
MDKTPLEPTSDLKGETLYHDAVSAQLREQRYAPLFDLMIQGFALAEIIRDDVGRPCDFRVLEVNEACGFMTGFYPEQANGRRARELIPDLEPHWLEAFARVVESGEPVRIEDYVAGLGKWVEVFAHRTGQDQFALLFIDVSERKRTEQAAVAQFKLADAVFANSIAPLVVLDRDYNFLRVNEAYARTCRLDISDFAGRNHFEMYPSDAKLIFDEVIRTKQPARTFTQAFVFPDQPERGVTYWDWTLVPILGRDGEVESLFLSLLDVTESEVAADALRQSETRYRRQAAELELIYRTLPIGLCVLDTELRYVHINARLAELNRIPAEAHLGKTVRELLPQVADHVEPLLRRVLETGLPVIDFEASAADTAGVIRQWVSQYWPLKSSDGTVFGINTVTQEITERRRLEEARRREQEFRSLAENSMDIISRFDRERRRIYMNPAIEAMFGRSRDELLGKTLLELDLPDALTRTFDRMLKEVFETGEPRTVDAVVPTPKGDRYLDARLVPEFGLDGEVNTVLTITRDLTQRKQAEDALQESEQKYRTLVDNLYEGIWLIDDAEKTTFVNTRMAELLGYASDEMLGRSLSTFVDPQHVNAARDHLQWSKSGARAAYELEFRRKDGEAIWARVASAPLFNAHGQYRGALAAVVDITERKHAEDALHRREQEFSALAERSPDIIARVDAALRVLYINPAIERITGQPRESFIGKTPAECELPQEEIDLRVQAVRQVFDSGQEQVLEHKNPTLTGDRFYQTRLVPEFGADGTVERVLMVSRDIDDLKRAQAVLEELALVDPLTGVANRRYLERFVGSEWLREARKRLPIAAIMIDIDHFKDYNDHYGHAQGDECLRQVTRTLKEALHRPADTLVRYGGEEFIVLLPESDLAAALDIAERLRHAVESHTLFHLASPLASQITISLGVAAMNAHEGEFDDLLADADAALYRAKEKGRNRVETSA